MAYQILPANVIAESPSTVGQLDTPVQDRSIQHYYIAEIELAMLERGSGSTDRTIAGLAVGIAATCGVVDRTVGHLSAYNHAIFVVGFWVFLVLAAYSGYRAREARSLNRQTAADVRERKTQDSPDGREAPSAPLVRPSDWRAVQVRLGIDS
jgi:hypothetical protein